MPITISSVKTEELTFNHFIHQNPSDSRNMFAKHVHDRFEIILFISGDATYIMSENENMGFYLPEHGTNLWSDAMVIPKNAKNPDFFQKTMYKLEFLC